MNVLILHPGYTRMIMNDPTYAFLYANRSDVNPLVITARNIPPRGIWNLPSYEQQDGIPVHRIFRNFFEMSMFPQKSLNQILKLAGEFRPDVIYCSQELNMWLAVALKKRLSIPILLIVEMAREIVLSESRSRLMSIFMQIFGIPYGRDYWSWLSKWSDAIITCHPNDQHLLNRLSADGARVFFVPWCFELPKAYCASRNRIEGRAMYAGDFSNFKNTNEFVETIPQLMERTPTREFFSWEGETHESLKN